MNSNRLKSIGQTIRENNMDANEETAALGKLVKILYALPPQVRRRILDYMNLLFSEDMTDGTNREQAAR